MIAAIFGICRIIMSIFENLLKNIDGTVLLCALLMVFNITVCGLLMVFEMRSEYNFF